MRPDPNDRRPPRKPELRPIGPRNPLDRGKILGIADAVVAAHQCELLERSVSDSLRIRLVVDRDEGPLDTVLLVTLIRELREALYDAEIDPGGFDIEVDSPGENRVLETARHFERFRGENVKVTLAEPDAEGRSTRAAVLLGADGDLPRVRTEDGVEQTLPRDAWLRIRLVPAAPKARPAAKGKQRKKQNKAKKAAKRSKKKSG